MKCNKKGALCALASVLLLASSMARAQAVPAAQAAPRDYSKVEIKTNQITDNFYTLDGDGGTKHRNRDGVLAGLREGRHGRGGEQGGGDEKRTSSHHQLPQRNSAVADCIIWSAAVITFAFISYARCAAIRLDISETTSTFDCSRLPWVRLP